MFYTESRVFHRKNLNSKSERIVPLERKVQPDARWFAACLTEIFGHFIFTKKVPAEGAIPVFLNISASFVDVHLYTNAGKFQMCITFSKM